MRGGREGEGREEERERERKTKAFGVNQYFFFTHFTGTVFWTSVWFHWVHMGRGSTR